MSTTAAVKSASIQLGTDRVNALLARLAAPHRKLPSVVHVAGTNGKGSTCAIISCILRAAGLRTGRFSSPHFLTPCDAVLVDNIPIQSQEYARLTSLARSFPDLVPTPFETECVVAFLHFAEQNVDVAVIEVGMGGLRDATNVFCNAPEVPVLPVFTPIALDHTEFLGSTVAQIAQEKAGILHAGVSACVIAQQKAFQEAADIIMQKTREVGCPHVLQVNQHACRYIAAIEPGTFGDSDGWVRAQIFGERFDVQFPLLGDFQLENLATALEAINAFYSYTRPDLNRPPLEAVKRGIRETKWPGRLELLTPVLSNQRITILADGAHNAHAAAALREYIDSRVLITSTATHVLWILGTKRDPTKLNDLVRILVRPGDTVWGVHFDQPQNMPWINASDSGEVCEAVRSRFPDGEVVVEDKNHISDAVRALSATNLDKYLVVCCGSLYLMASLHRFLGSLLSNSQT
ncbi:hypothetical protein HDU83_002209 [Entophlyctis luteolus]|nr:hypothetical protein HDU83_002209 [Entophlyctis luteolus]